MISIAGRGGSEFEIFFIGSAVEVPGSKSAYSNKGDSEKRFYVQSSSVTTDGYCFKYKSKSGILVIPL
jgi:hypothetical protein